MSRTIFKAKICKVNRAASASAASDASAYCRDLDNWPRSWMGLEKDLPPGEELVACFRPFIERCFEFIPLWGFLVFLLYRMQRVDCRNCGVVVEEVPWGDGKRASGLIQSFFEDHSPNT